MASKWTLIGSARGAELSYKGNEYFKSKGGAGRGGCGEGERGRYRVRTGRAGERNVLGLDRREDTAVPTAERVRRNYVSLLNYSKLLRASASSITL